MTEIVHLTINYKFIFSFFDTTEIVERNFYFSVKIAFALRQVKKKFTYISNNKNDNIFEFCETIARTCLFVKLYENKT